METGPRQNRTGADVKEAKHLRAYLKSLATLTPTSTVVGNTLFGAVLIKTLAPPNSAEPERHPRGDREGTTDRQAGHLRCSLSFVAAAWMFVLPPKRSVLWRGGEVDTVFGFEKEAPCAGMDQREVANKPESGIRKSDGPTPN